MIKKIETKQNNVKLTVFTSDENSFMVTSTLIEKAGHAFLINAKFTQSDAKEIVEYIEKSNLTLDKIFIIHGDPDYYFGLETIKAAFPKAIAYATQPTVEHIASSVLGKLQVWKPVLLENAPTNIVLPQVFAEKTIEFQGLTFDLVGLDNHRISLFNKELELLFGGIDTFNEIHIFLADTSSKEAMEDWTANLKKLQELHAKIVVPSHGSIEKSFDDKLLTATIDYLETAIKASEQSKNSADFIEKLEAAYPGFANKGVLALSAKVVMKEIPWG
ncbi:MBL fold metallo-hydrolase [Clostridium estertheticum]|uniref:MBL fold metallo-hydrolase n=1 Tax=Clostridium estertheticum TaxID=238834 RepID=A0AA47EG05_9CLOT|nr:MBL fold metallo-hydrolase [Clostridium estertheticum]MBU3156561.1 MBL fold metallo-hydrolase [Clostridium estertheticum]WAG59321.1 MBL fold metallo-hydrolase [Clostridium estertheticum]